MAITFVANSSNNAFIGAAGESVVNPVGTTAGDLLLCCFCFGSVSSSSGPYVASAPLGWLRIGYRAPSASGTAIEVWGSIYTSGIGATFNFTGTYTGNMRESVYRGVTPIGGTVTSLVADVQTAQNTGNDPVAPSATVDQAGSMVVVCAADTLSSTGFGYPAPYTKRWDNASGGTFGQPEDALGEHLGASVGPTGTISLTAPVTPSGAKGTTMTFVIRLNGVVGTDHLLPLIGVGH